MRSTGSIVRVSIATVLGLMCVAAADAGRAASPLRQGDEIGIGGRRGVVTLIETLPYIESDYTKRFTFDTHLNPKLRQLRERYRLEEAIAAGRDEFDRQILLLDWVHHRFKRFGRPTSDARGALDILEAIEAGHTFFCSHYGDVFVSAAASMGWIARPLALRRPDHLGQGSTEHTSTEIWSSQHRKWIMLDPTFAMYVEKDGVPLNAYELRQEWFGRDGRELVFVVGKERKRYRRSDMPVVRGRFAGFGDLSLDDSAVNVYAFIGYVPNNNLMDAGLDYGRMFITQDALCAGTKWHKRTIPADPATDPYFPINQASLTLTATDGAIEVKLKTLTPNFKHYVGRIDGGEWGIVGEVFKWRVHPGDNRLEVKTVNWFGIEGPVSTARIEFGAGAEALP